MRWLSEIMYLNPKRIKIPPIKCCVKKIRVYNFDTLFVSKFFAVKKMTQKVCQNSPKKKN